MPYIPTEKEREALDPAIDNLVKALNKLNHAGADTDVRDNDGRLNYSLCEILMKSFGCDQAPRYTKFNSMFGVLLCVILEIYRRATGPYEDAAIEKNGDIGTFARLLRFLSLKE